MEIDPDKKYAVFSDGRLSYVDMGKLLKIYGPAKSRAAGAAYLSFIGLKSGQLASVALYGSKLKKQEERREMLEAVQNTIGVLEEIAPPI